MWITEDAAAQLTAAAENAHPNETGGLLVGLYTAERPWITQVVEVPSERGAKPAFYEFPAGRSAAIIESARRDDDRIGYLGEWHSHPFDVGPSSTDMATMKQIGLATASRPVLVVVRRKQTNYVLDASQWTGRSLRSLRLVASGQPSMIDEHALPRMSDSKPRS